MGALGLNFWNPISDCGVVPLHQWRWVMLNYLLDRYIRQGSLTVVFPGGYTRTFGQGEPHARVRMQDWAAVRELGWNPDRKSVV